MKETKQDEHYIKSKDIEDLRKEKERLEQQVENMIQSQRTHLHDYFTRNKFKFGYVTDTQMGSIHENLNLLYEAYRVFKREGIDIVYHTGDLMDGEKMHRGQEYEIYAHGADQQVANVIAKYPKFKGIDTFYILGNHDEAFKKSSGIVKLITSEIDRERPDMHFMGLRNATVELKSGRNKIKLDLVHPGKGTAYALSYHPQKLVEALTGGQKPNIMLTGHFHKSEWLPAYRNVETFQGGCTQHQTPWMKTMNIAAHQGFWIIEGRMEDNQIARLKGEWFPYYEK